MALKLSTGLVNAMLDTHCFKNTMALGFLRFLSGSQPTNADAIETVGSVVLLEVTVGSGATGISWTDATLNVISKATEVWSGVGLADGTAGWFRFYAAAKATGASTTAVRFDGRITVVGGGGEIELSSTTIATGATTAITTCTFTLPLFAA